MPTLIPRMRELSSKLLLRGYRLFEGSGIGKIPGVFSLYERAIATNGLTYVNGQYMRSLNSEHEFMYGNEDYEQVEHAHFCSVVDEGMTVVDIGAAIGYYSLAAAEYVGETGRVLAFEPTPRRLEILTENIKHNGWTNVETSDLAISDHTGTIEFRENPVEVHEGQAARLPDIVDECPDIIKLDIEGGEVAALRGMEPLLAERHTIVFCEVHPAHIESLGESIEEIDALLARCGYQVTQVCSDGSVSPAEISHTERDHYVFTPSDSGSQ